jgi:signal transduction histidine kinase
VVLAYTDQVLEIEVRDDGAHLDHAASAGPGGFGLGGFGLGGMRERAALYDGSVRAGPSVGGGWAVHARLVAVDRELQ